MDRATTCCFTGHRPDKLPLGQPGVGPRCLTLKRRLTQAVEGAYAQGMRHFICGMAGGRTCTLRRRCWPCACAAPASLWRPPAPARVRPTPGLRQNGTGIGHSGPVRLRDSGPAPL